MVQRLFAAFICRSTVTLPASLAPKRLFVRAMATTTEPRKFLQTSGENDVVWVHTDPYSNRPKFPALNEDLEAEVCIVGAGIAGISTAYELVRRGHEVVLVEARDVLSGETGRSSGHLSAALDDGFVQITRKHGKSGAKAAADSHFWALQHVGEVARELGIECEYRRLPEYNISQHVHGTRAYDDEIRGLQEEVVSAREAGLDAEFRADLAIKGWDGPDQRGGAVFHNLATFHPTKYLVGVLGWLNKQPRFRMFTSTRVTSVEEHGIEVLGLGRSTVTVGTESGHTVKAQHAVEATCAPLQKLAVIVQMAADRTYCIAARTPKGSIEDCLLCDEAEAYKYVRLTECDGKDDYVVVGGCDHLVGQENPAGRYEELEVWLRKRFPSITTVDYRWSGQVFEPVDYVAFIGRNQGSKHTYIVTGDSGTSSCPCAPWPCSPRCSPTCSPRCSPIQGADSRTASSPAVSSPTRSRASRTRGPVCTHPTGSPPPSRCCRR